MKYKSIGSKDKDSKYPGITEKTKKIMLSEYIVHSVISIFAVFFFTIKLCIKCYNFAKEYNFNINGLQEGYSFLGGHRDLSDFQYRNYRNFFFYIVIGAIVSVAIGKILKTFWREKVLKTYYLIFCLGFGFYLHRFKLLYLIIVLLIAYLFKYFYKIVGRNIFILSTWLYVIAIKITTELYDGYSVEFISNEFLKNEVFTWRFSFGFVMLRVISFNYEYANVVDNNTKSNYLTDMNKIKEHCKECAKGRFCLTALKFVSLTEKDFPFTNLLIYALYPPVYFTGPTIMYHCFIFQVNHVEENKHNDIFYKEKIIYFFRVIINFVILEVFNHFIYVDAIRGNRDVLEKFKNDNSYFFLFFLSFNSLVFTFLKYSLMWKFARLWGWCDGIYNEENMNRCIYNNYSFEGFWRQWHRSYNIWLIRYMYIPLGGKKWKFLNTFVIFSFVALWHDLEWHLLVWAWCIYFSIVPEIIIKTYFNNEKRKYLLNYMWFRYLRALACSFDVCLMVIANLAGFASGGDSFETSPLYPLFKGTTPFRFFFVMMFFAPATFTMFFIRHLEKIHGIKKNF
jgi:D-alanyl-lipoteichoic acid acyltransferase DltB (MBOAT superfamily)